MRPNMLVLMNAFWLRFEQNSGEHRRAKLDTARGPRHLWAKPPGSDGTTTRKRSPIDSDGNDVRPLDAAAASPRLRRGFDGGSTAAGFEPSIQRPDNGNMRWRQHTSRCTGGASSKRAGPHKDGNQLPRTAGKAKTATGNLNRRCSPADRLRKLRRRTNVPGRCRQRLQVAPGSLLLAAPTGDSTYCFIDDNTDNNEQQIQAKRIWPAQSVHYSPPNPTCLPACLDWLVYWRAWPGVG